MRMTTKQVHIIGTTTYLRTRRACPAKTDASIAELKEGKSLVSELIGG